MSVPIRDNLGDQKTLILGQEIKELREQVVDLQSTLQEVTLKSGRPFIIDPVYLADKITLSSAITDYKYLTIPKDKVIIGVTLGMTMSGQGDGNPAQINFSPPAMTIPIVVRNTFSNITRNFSYVVNSGTLSAVSTPIYNVLSYSDGIDKGILYSRESHIEIGIKYTASGLLNAINNSFWKGIFSTTYFQVTVGTLTYE